MLMRSRRRKRGRVTTMAIITTIAIVATLLLGLLQCVEPLCQVIDVQQLATNCVRSETTLQFSALQLSTNGVLNMTGSEGFARLAGSLSTL